MKIEFLFLAEESLENFTQEDIENFLKDHYKILSIKNLELDFENGVIIARVYSNFRDLMLNASSVNSSSESAYLSIIEKQTKDIQTMQNKLNQLLSRKEPIEQSEQIQLYENQIENLNKQVSEMDIEKSIIQKNVKDLEMRNKELTEEIDKINSTLNVRKRVNSLTRDKYEEQPLEDQITKLEEFIKVQKNEHEEEIQHYQQKFNQLNLKLIEAKEEQQKLFKSNEELKEIANMYNTASEELQKLKDEYYAREAKITNLQSDAKKFQDSISLKNGKLKKLKSLSKKLDSDNKILKTQLENLKKSIEEKDASIKKEEKEKNNNNNNNIVIKEVDLIETNNQNSRLNELEKENKLIRKEYDVQCKTLEDLKEKIEKYKLIIAKKDNEINAWKEGNKVTLNESRIGETSFMTKDSIVASESFVQNKSESFINVIDENLNTKEELNNSKVESKLVEKNPNFEYGDLITNESTYKELVNKIQDFETQITKLQELLNKKREKSRNNKKEIQKLNDKIIYEKNLYDCEISNSKLKYEEVSSQIKIYDDKLIEFQKTIEENKFITENLKKENEEKTNLINNMKANFTKELREKVNEFESIKINNSNSKAPLTDQRKGEFSSDSDIPKEKEKEKEKPGKKFN